MFGDFGEELEARFTGELYDFEFQPTADDAEPVAVFVEESFDVLNGHPREAFEGFGEFIEFVVEGFEPAFRLLALQFTQFLHEFEPAETKLRPAVVFGEFRGVARVGLCAEGVNEDAEFRGCLDVEFFMSVFVLRDHRLTDIGQDAEFALGDAEFFAERTGAAFGFHGCGV